MSGEQRAESKGSRVESWKGIAAFFQRDERTVKRWERERGLPVHRMPGERGGVFAYTGQLEIWLNSGAARSASRPGQAVAGAVQQPFAAERSVAVEELPEAALEPDASLPKPEREQTQPLPSEAVAVPPKVRASIWIGIAAMLLLAAGVVLWMSDRPHPGRRSAADDSASAEARELYLTGKYFWTRRTEDSLKHAEQSFQQAIARDPGYAPAYAGLAETYDLLPEYGSAAMASELPRAMVAARKAIALDDSLAEAHRALGWALFFGQWDARGAFAEFRRALQLDPKDVEAHHWYGNALVTLGRYEEGRKQLEMARRLEPSSSSIELDYANALYYLDGRDGSESRQQAIAKMLEIERLDDAYLAPPRYLKMFYLKQQDYAGYLTQLQRAALISHNPDEERLAQAAETGWDTNGARGLLDRLYAEQKQEFAAGRSSGYELGMTCVLLGRKPEADQYLRSAFARRDPVAMSVVSDAFYDRMKDDPEFQRLKREMKAVLQTN